MTQLADLAFAFSPLRPQSVVVVSLVGHYERTASWLLSDAGLRRKPGVTRVQALRVRARSAPSLLRALSILGRHTLLGQGPLIGIPRSNSRALRLLVLLLPGTKFFSYSDGLGDSIHRFVLELHPRYIGHIGFAAFGGPRLLYEIPLAQCVEPWGQYVVYERDAPVLVIAKAPKETLYDRRHLEQLYRRTIASVGRGRSVLLSGAVPGMALPACHNIVPIASLAKLDAPLRVSGAVGLPSTAFLTLATRLPAESLRVMRLCCARTHPDTNQRIDVMKNTLERCMALLSAPAIALTTGQAGPAGSAM
jgi:hypothetical protein